MRSVVVVLTVVLVGAIVLVPLIGRRPDTESPRDSAHAPAADQPVSAASGSEVLREQLLSREMLRDIPDPDGDGIRAVVFDWGIDDGTATLVAFEDGTTSLYFSGGGGIIGAGAHEAVKRAAASFREEAVRVQARLTRADAFPLPVGETSVFYLVTDSATLTSGPIPNADLEQGKPPFGELANRAQRVITEIRKAP